ncbi:hypothetical protein ACTXJ9_11135 [Brachybacterium tyrofermentans]|uniref:hypothetical protein n=1 Tax=Brachybacterium tyrofermentans TaxID=47848 RepID=UPI003FD0403C
MAEKKNESVTLVKDGRKVTTSLPREIVQYKAAGWREEVPEADSSKDRPKSEPVKADDAKSAAAGSDAKGGTKK